MVSDEDIEVGSAAVFSFGKSKFADNLPSKFWMKNDQIRLVACGDEHTIVVTEYGKVYSFGSNDWGQLGLENCNETSITKPTLVNALKDEKVVCVAGGRCHTIFGTESGKVFSCGCNGEGQLGLGDSRGRSEPCQVTAIAESVKMVSAGSHHSAVLTDAGSLFVFGSNSEGQLGLGSEESLTLSPKQLQIGKPIVQVACGYYHTAFITDDGILYTFGENEDKLGLDVSQRLQKTDKPQIVSDIGEKVVAVACGGNHTVVVTGTLFTFGCGVRGQLGQGNVILESSVPGLVKALNSKKVVKVSCGESHTAVVTDDGILYTFGDGRHGKLGHGNDHSANQFVPCIVTSFPHFAVEQVACGGCHLVVVARKLQTESYSGDEMETGLANSAVQHNNLARSRRRLKDDQIPRQLPKILPPLNKIPPPQSVEDQQKLEASLKVIDAIKEQDEDCTSLSLQVSQFNKTPEMTTLDHNRSQLLSTRSKSSSESQDDDEENKAKSDEEADKSEEAPERFSMPSAAANKDAVSSNPKTEKDKSFLSRIFNFPKTKTALANKPLKKITKNETLTTTKENQVENEIAVKKLSSIEIGTESTLTQCSTSKACNLL